MRVAGSFFVAYFLTGRFGVYKEVCAQSLILRRGA